MSDYTDLVKRLREELNRLPSTSKDHAAEVVRLIDELIRERIAAALYGEAK